MMDTPNISIPTEPTKHTIDLSRGDQFFVRYPLTHGNTIYLYDKNRKFHVPFHNSQAFQALSGVAPDQAYNEGMIHDLTDHLPGHFVPDQHGFNETGMVSNPAYYQ